MLKKNEDLATIIYNKILDDFLNKNFSQNLVDTIKTINYKNKTEIIIPAQKYDMWLYHNKKIINYINDESYAEEINQSGSKFVDKNGNQIRYFGNHINFADDSVVNGISEWLAKNKMKGNIKIYD